MTAEARPAITPVVVKGLTIGEGRPKIIVPVTGATVDDVLAHVDGLAGHHVDIVEWRADHLAALDRTDDVVAAAHMLVDRLAGVPLLFTCRTEAEGGAAAVADEGYGELVATLAASGTVDLVDVEYQRDRAVVDHLIDRAHAHRVAVVASNHDVAGTPPRDEIVARLQAMHDLGADICKIAVMPHSAADVLALLDATWIVHEQRSGRPLVTVAMGGLGVVSRLAGQVFGSAATFGMVGIPSAPGQVDADDLHAVLRLLDAAM